MSHAKLNNSGINTPSGGSPVNVNTAFTKNFKVGPVGGSHSNGTLTSQARSKKDGTGSEGTNEVANGAKEPTINTTP